jgi:hypothetical protein
MRQVTTFYHLKYQMTEERATLVTALVHSVLREDGYAHLWRGEPVGKDEL